MPDDKQAAIVAVLNRLLEAELAGVVRYTHYSFLVFGFGRIPIVSWLRAQAEESLLHAQQIGEWITALGAYPSLAIGVADRASTIRDHAARVADSERQARCCTASPLPAPRVTGVAGGIRARDDPGRGVACRRGRQDAAQAR